MKTKMTDKRQDKEEAKVSENEISQKNQIENDIQINQTSDDKSINNMESGNNSVINAMGSFTEINSEKMQEIENEIARQKSLYSSMNEQIQSYTDEEEKNRASAINNNRYTQIKQLESDKEQLEEALVNTNNADTAGTANLTSINTTFVNFENCFMEQ